MPPVEIFRAAASPPASRLVGPCAAVFVTGAALRWAALSYTTPDATDYLLPWYGVVLARGAAALGDAFTNYAPLYSYLLLAASWFDAWGAPLTLIKSISFAFELGCALVAAKLVSTVDPRPARAATAFGFVWVAPSVLHNGALWAQSEAIWTFFLLVTILALCRGRPAWALLAYGIAVSVKAQAVFLAPVLLGAMLAGHVRWRLLALVPVAYLVLALPTLIFGRPIESVLLVYLRQAGTFGSLSMNAANPWIFVPPSLYGPGTVVGLALAATVGLALALAIRRGTRWTPDTILLASAASLIWMPFVLPKMHERYFYGFEILILVLAAARPKLAGAALLAQATSALAYLPFDGMSSIGLPLAAINNGLLIALVTSRMSDALSGWRDPFRGVGAWQLPVQAVWMAYAVQLICLVAFAPDPDALWPARFTDPIGLSLFAALVAGALLLIRQRGTPSGLAASSEPERISG